LNKNAAGAQTINTIFTNAGTVNVNAGTLVLSNSGSYTGRFDVVGTAALALSGGTQDFGSGASVTGAGTLQATGAIANFNAGSSPGIAATGTVSVSGGALNFSSGGTVALADGLTLSGGSLTGADDVTVSGPFGWSAGTVSGTGLFTTLSGSTTTLTTQSPVLSGRTWTSQGPVTLAAGSRLSLQNAAVVNIGAGS